MSWVGASANATHRRVRERRLGPTKFSLQGTRSQRMYSLHLFFLIERNASIFTWSLFVKISITGRYSMKALFLGARCCFEALVVRMPLKCMQRIVQVREASRIEVKAQGLVARSMLCNSCLRRKLNVT